MREDGVAFHERCFAVRFIFQFSRLSNGIIGRSGIKHKGINRQSSEKARFVALASGFDANKFYIWQTV
jgi:hypothetical protein